MSTPQTIVQPLDFLKLLAHQIRWRILLALSRSDYRVDELVEQIKQPYNLVSYHLKRLRSQRLVRERRSSADSRGIYYSLDLDQLRQLYFQAGQSLHPAIGDILPEPLAGVTTSKHKPVRILFLCTHNSARSQMAEGLLRKIAGDQVDVFSAGSEPTPIHPLAVKVMAEIGVHLSQQRPKHFNEFIGQHFDYIVTVCDRVREVCPVFPGDPRQIHWSFPDPVAVEGNPERQEKAFIDTSTQLMTRIKYLSLMIERNQKEKK